MSILELRSLVVLGPLVMRLVALPPTRDRVRFLVSSIHAGDAFLGSSATVGFTFGRIAKFPPVRNEDPVSSKDITADNL